MLGLELGGGGGGSGWAWDWLRTGSNTTNKFGFILKVKVTNQKNWKKISHIAKNITRLMEFWKINKAVLITNDNFAYLHGTRLMAFFAVHTSLRYTSACINSTFKLDLWSLIILPFMLSALSDVTVETITISKS